MTRMRKDKITYDFYYNEFCGGKGAELSLDAFDSYVGKARREVFGMLTAEYSEEQKNAVFSAVCEVAEALYHHNGKDGISSENIDGYSVTYREGNSLDTDVRRAALRHLGNTGLVYAGVGIC